MGMRNASLDELLNRYDIFDNDFVSDPFPLLDQIREVRMPDRGQRSERRFVDADGDMPMSWRWHRLRRSLRHVRLA